MSGASPVEGWLTIDEAAGRLSLSGASIRRYCRDGKLTKVHHGGRAYIVETSVTEYIARLTAQGEADRARAARARRGRK